MDYVSVSFWILTFLLTVNVNCDILDERFQILYSDILKCDHNKSLNLDVSEINIYFYDFVNKINVTSQIEFAATQILPFMKSSERKLIFFIPGYKCSIQRNVEEWIRQTFKDVPDVYLIIVDHSSYTFESEEKLKSYSRSVLYSYYIGKALGKLLAAFTKEGMISDRLHCVGHSLGGQMLGYASEAYFQKTKQKIGRVTALDPAGPCFSQSRLEDQVRSGVAKYVEVYHCNAGHLGTTSLLADTDFVFNKHGKVQPGCEGRELEDTAKCYHQACIKYWVATVHNSNLYVARFCDSYKDFTEGLCSDNEFTIAGYFNPGNVTGVFYVSTEEQNV